MVVLDPETRNKIPGAANMFLKPSFPMSASFEGTVPNDRIQPIHINPNKSVNLTKDKGRLLNHLGRKGNPVGNFLPMENFIEGGSFNLAKLEDTFDLEEAPVDIIGELGQLSVDELEDLLAYLRKMESGAVIGRTKVENPVTGYVRTIPNAEGKRLNLGNRDVSDGVLNHNIPLQRISKGTEMINGAKKALDDTGLDYGTVFIRFNTDGDFDIMDIQTGLHREDCIAIRSYAEMLHKVMRKSNGGKR